MTEIFISYTRNANPDVELASFFANYLRDKGHNVFIDKEIPVGVEWPDITRQKLEDADFFLILLSDHSIRSEMVIEEVRIVYRRRQKQGLPIILPIKISSDIELPYDLGSYLNRIQYVLWKTNRDTESIANMVIAAIEKQCPFDEDCDVLQVLEPFSDSNIVKSSIKIVPPSPSVNYQFLLELAEPRGVIGLPSQFYIERDVDDVVRAEVLKRGRTVSIKGGRQTGKSSLLARANFHAKNNGYSVVYVTFDMIDENYANTLDTMLHYLADVIAKTLKISIDPQSYWSTSLPAKMKLTEFLRESVLATLSNPVILAMDGVDRLFRYSFKNDFFSLIRAWHDMRAQDELFKLLNIVLSYSTESFLMIEDVISPFNVGTRVELKDFTQNQLKELNERYGKPIQSENELNTLHGLIGGHPFLAHIAFYELVIHKWSVSDLEAIAMSDDGPFAEHLRWYRLHLHKSPSLESAFKEILAGNPCTNEQFFYRLRSVGLIQGHDGRSAISRCNLYTRYFTKYL